MFQKELKLWHPRPSGQAFRPDVDFAEWKHPQGQSGAACWTASNAALNVNHASILPFRAIAALFSQPELVGPIWIECDPGCCT